MNKEVATSCGIQGCQYFTLRVRLAQRTQEHDEINTAGALEKLAHRETRQERDRAREAADRNLRACVEHEDRLEGLVERAEASERRAAALTGYLQHKQDCAKLIGKFHDEEDIIDGRRLYSRVFEAGPTDMCTCGLAELLDPSRVQEPSA